MDARVTPNVAQNVGTSVLPDEAKPLLQGEGRFINDVQLPNMYHVTFLRSSHAHARILSIDASRALAAPGVAAVLTGKDLLGRVEPFRSMPNRFSAGAESTQHWLAVDKVRFFGEALCAVVANSRALAEDAAELIEVEYDPLPVITDPREGEKAGAPLIHDTCPNNHLIKREYDFGDVDAAFEAAHLVFKRRFRIGRKQALCMEPRGCVAVPRDGSFLLTLWISHQLPYVVRHYLARHLRIHESQVRVVAPHTGGGFGQKASVYPEEFVCAYLALALRRPVKWIEDRLENMVASTHSRDQYIELEAAFDREGRILGLSSQVWVDVGAYSTYLWSAGMEPLQTGGLMPGPYKIGAYKFTSRGVATNKTPVGPYRAVGRPSASAALELVFEEAARRLGLDPVAVRCANLINPEDMPFRNANNLVHENVDYLGCLKTSLAEADYRRLRADQAQARAEGRLVGIGVTCYAELTGLGTSTPVGPGTMLQPGRDSVTVRLETSGVVTVMAAMPTQGQRIATALRQVAADALGMKLSDVAAITSDTAMAPYSFGTFASRTAVLGSGACIRACQELKKRILALAAHMMSVSADELAIVDSLVQTGDGAQTLALKEMAERSYFSAKNIPPELNPGFEVTAFYDPKFGSFAGAAHVAVVEIDPGTGHVGILRYVATEDVGTMINPEVVKGQIIGGIAQGIGEALMEELVYDESGQPRTVTLVDFVVPTAVEMPRVELHHANTPSAALGGFKGCGEGSQTGGLASLACAISDALAARGGDIHDFPATPERVLRGLGVLAGQEGE